MNEFVKINESDDMISISFCLGDDKFMNIGAKMEEINPEAYMNGYNWEALLGYYLAKSYPHLLDGMQPDPEAGMYAAYYEVENKGKAEELAKIITNLIENEQELYKFVEENSEEIEWD